MKFFDASAAPYAPGRCARRYADGGAALAHPRFIGSGLFGGKFVSLPPPPSIPEKDAYVPH